MSLPRSEACGRGSDVSHHSLCKVAVNRDVGLSRLSFARDQVHRKKRADRRFQEWDRIHQVLIRTRNFLSTEM